MLMVEIYGRKMKKGLLYIHGRGGEVKEAEHYKTLFPEYDVAGLDYRARTPWDAKAEFCRFFDLFKEKHNSVTIVAVSFGAFLALNAFNARPIEMAYFISPIVDMEKLIRGMMAKANVTESELKEKGIVRTDWGEDLSWKYLSYVTKYPIRWNVPTKILYGGKDDLTSVGTITAFAKAHHATLTVMENGEHWFHTDEQMAFLDNWIKRQTADKQKGNDESIPR